MINSFKNFVEMALNKNQMGKPSPSEFNHAVAEAELKNYTELFADFRKINYRKSRFQDTPNYGSEAEYMKQALEWYVKESPLTLKDGTAVMPKDFFAVNSIFSDKAEVEKVDMSVFNSLKRRNRNKPSACSPVFTYNDGVLKVFPDHSKVDITYFRKLKMPKWTYRIIGGVEMFDMNAPDYQDLDCHPIMYHNVFVDTLQLLGLNIKEEYALQYIQQMKQEQMINQH